MELRKGYKKTEVGVIPEGWATKRLRDLITLIPSGVYGEEKPRDSLLAYRVATTAHIEMDDTWNEKEMKTRYFTFGQVDRYSPREGDLIVVKSSGSAASIQSGKIGFVDNCRVGRFLFSNFLMLLRPTAIHSQYLYYYLCSHNVKKLLPSLVEASTYPNIRILEYLGLNIPLPKPDEQIAIAGALSDVDASLRSLDQLIAKKRDLKQAAMQELLTGKTRLPGFKGEWETKRLGNLGCFLKGNGVKKDDARSGALPCIRYGEIYTHHNDYIKVINSWISPEVAAEATRLKKGDLLFAGSGETKEEIGKCVAFVGDFEAYAGGDIVILRPEGVDSTFMGYYCNTTPIIAQKASKGQGDAVVHISATSLSNIVVTIPQLTEQAALASVLTDMDTEIEALEKRRDKTRDLKQAMMQELLTGKTRLI